MITISRPQLQEIVRDATKHANLTVYAAAELMRVASDPNFKHTAFNTMRYGHLVCCPVQQSRDELGEDSAVAAFQLDNWRASLISEFMHRYDNIMSEIAATKLPGYAKIIDD